VKHTDHFNVLLRDTINLTQFNLDVLEDKSEEVVGVLEDDDTAGSEVVSMKRQGSWAQRTIITPPWVTDFDADIMVRLKHNPAWDEEPRKYSNLVYNAFANSPVLSWREFERHDRCVRVHYEKMHVDVVPYVVFPDGSQRIINRNTGEKGEFEVTNPEAFTTWMKEKDELANGNLRKVIRILKYLRDRNKSFTGTPSIIITTLLGNQVTAKAKLDNPDAFKDVPQTLLTLVTGMNHWLAGYNGVPPVTPSGTSIDFTHRWKPESFSYFKDRMAVHGGEIEDAYYEENEADSVEKWQALFGDGFKAPKTSEGGSGGAAGAATTTTSRAG
jgi:hypothetical protein